MGRAGDVDVFTEIIGSVLNVFRVYFDFFLLKMIDV